MCSGFCDALRGTGPRATGTRAFFSVPCEGQALALRLRRRAARATVVRRPVPRRAFSVSEAGFAGCPG